jgi:NAD(P)-dependent dehydrogenase (short-subunit alcohol dehydrogenase family)
MNVLITGSSSGIGQQLARDYLAQGDTVYCCGRNKSALQSLVDDYPDLAHATVFDIQNLRECRQALESIHSLDLVILNAGTCEYIDASKFDAELFERVVRTNLIGMANCLECVIPRIKPGGQLGLMGSSSSYVPLPRAEAYGASKAATEYLAKTLAITLQKLNIFVSYIAPGFVETPLTNLNDFPMPMKVDVHFASNKIRRGLEKRRSEIHFPILFTLILKALSLLPNALQRFLLSKTLS